MSLEIWTAGWVVPVGTPPLRRGSVAVDGERIVWVGEAGDPSRPVGPVRDLGPGVLLPGLVNAHCHLELSHLAGRLEGASDFVSWVEAVVAARGQEAPEAVEALAEEAIARLTATGTVAVGDVSNTLLHLPALSRSRLAAAVVFYELLAWDPGKALSVLEFARARAREAAEGLSPRVEVRLAAHAPHSVSAALFRALAAEGGPAALHLAESRVESEFLLSGNGDWARFLERRGLGHVAFAPPRQSPVQYVGSLGALHPGLVAAHCVEIDDADAALLAERGVAVALCPRSNLRLGGRLPPVPALRGAGVRLCVGTDSLASAPSLDLMDDVVALRAAFPEIEPAAWIEMATAGGAEALGLGHLGTIAPGKSAALSYSPAEEVPLDPWVHVVDGGAAARLQPAVGA